jgi:hypothetical protein
VTGAFVFVAAAAGIAACASSSRDEIGWAEPPDAAAPPRVIAEDPSVGDAACDDESLSCLVWTNCTTTLTGTVLDPAGRNPIFGAVVFVPSTRGELPPIATGSPSCDLCGPPIGDYVTAAGTDASGRFTLSNVPAGSDIPLVVQTGKWRRQITLPSVTACSTVDLPDGLLRLPRNRSEGDMPQMALLAGGCDRFACFLRSVGIDASEFGPPNSGGRVDVYRGMNSAGYGPGLSSGVAGDCTTDSCPLWSNEASLLAYDQLLLGCECGPNDQTKPAASRQALHDFVAAGGRVMAVHSQSTWLENGPPSFQGIATWTDDAGALDPGPLAIGTSLKAIQLRKQLGALGALEGNGLLAVGPTDVGASVAAVDGGSVSNWLSDPGDGGVVAPRLFSLGVGLSSTTLPTDGEISVCGKFVFSDIHPGGNVPGVAADAGTDAGVTAPLPIPDSCDGAPLTPDQLALEFLLFDTNFCPPPPPPPNP